MIKVLYLMANVIAKRNEEDCLCIKLRQEYFEMQAMYEQIFNKMPCSRIYITNCFTNMSSFLPEARELSRRHLFQSKSQRPSKHQWRPQMFVVYKIVVVAIVFTKGIVSE